LGKIFREHPARINIVRRIRADILIAVEILHWVERRKHTQGGVVVPRAQVEQGVGVGEFTGEGEGGAEASTAMICRKVPMIRLYEN
jgi:hypothetical protein